MKISTLDRKKFRVRKKLKKVSNKEILALSEAYKVIFNTESLHENLAKLSETLKVNTYVKEVIDFINHDKKRPICTPLSK